MKQFTIGSALKAASALELLRYSGIDARMKKVTGSGGCAHVIEVSSSDAQAAAAILRNGGMYHDSR